MITPQTLKEFRDFLPGWLLPVNRIAVFIDAANAEKSVQKLGWKIHYKKLRRMLSSGETLIYLGYYTVSFRDPNHVALRNSLIRQGYTVKTKPLKILKNNKRKANFDVEIATDIAIALSTYDTVVLFSGDSDFAYTLELLRKHKKKVIVVSTKYRVSRELVERAHYYLDLKKIKEAIARH
ncbi:NYN domain-containing protein [Candidatus Gottesmanbacteria bacterium]|nr:NYN domain-containing protein [Candidatus Gottesmanbacteria bacterium]